MTKALNTSAFLYFFIRIAPAILFFLPLVSIQSQDNWPKLSLAYYDCNSTEASYTDISQQNAFNSASKHIYRNVINNITDNEIFFISYGFSDTTENDIASSGSSFFLPDTGRFIYAKYDFVIASSISGSPGSYTLTVSLLEGNAYTQIAVGTAQFASASIENISEACHNAVQQILPLTQKMRAFITAMKEDNQQLVINPKIDVTPAIENIEKNGSTEVAIHVSDCDGLPLVNRELAIETSRGSIDLTKVNTDENGDARIQFDAGGDEGVAILNATILNAINVFRDTITYNGSNSILIGDFEDRNLWKLTYDLSISSTSYRDHLREYSDGTNWIQENKFWTQRAYGSFIGTAVDEKNTEFEFFDSTMTLSGVIMVHKFGKETFTDHTGNACPKLKWSMSGTSETWKAMRNRDGGGDASLSYDPSGVELFSFSIPFKNAIKFSYKWSILGRWENADCRSILVHEGVPQKLTYAMAGGVSFYGFSPVPGLSISPFYSGGDVSGYFITISSNTSGIEGDGTVYYTFTSCTATLRKLSKTTSVRNTAEMAPNLLLEQNYPNPFKTTTRIKYSIPAYTGTSALPGERIDADLLSLKIYNLIGQEVAILVNDRQPAGNYEIEFDGSALASGVYYCKLKLGEHSQARKLVVVK